MPLIKITENESVKEYEVLPEGYYEVYIDAVDEPEAQGAIEKSTVRFRVRDDVDAQSGDKGRVLFVNLSTNPAIAWKLSNIATAAGIPAGTGFDTLEEYLEAIKGTSMKVKVAHRVYNDKTYADIKSFYPTNLKPYDVPTAGADSDLI
jgi:hypothetical protein